MKKLILFIGSLGALMSCNRVETLVHEGTKTVTVVNEAVEESVPFSFSIKGHSMKTRGLADMPAESALVNVSLTMTGFDSNDNQVYSESYELGSETDFIVNVRECKTVSFTVYSGPRDENGYLTTLDAQSEYLYAEGNVSLSWDKITSQKSPFELTLARRINKITIEKISVDWAEAINDTKEFKIKRIYLANVPRDSYRINTDALFYVYTEEFPENERVAKYYNISGIDDYSWYYSAIEKYLYPAPDRLDAQLVDEVDAIVSKGSPYVTPHVFYAYISNTSALKPQLYNGADRDKGYVLMNPAMTTIVIEAEMEGQKMYYRFQIHTPVQGQVLENTHIRFRELVITELGSPTFEGAKTYRNLAYEFQDWVEKDVSEPQESL